VLSEQCHNDLLFTLNLRFFETEGIAILTMMVSQYKITVKEEPQFAGETFNERKSRVLSAKPGLTVTYVSYYSYPNVMGNYSDKYSPTDLFECL